MTEVMMNAALLTLTFLFLASDCSAGSDCSSPSSTTETSRASLLSAVVDAHRAEHSQRQHLEALFNRYGENGTISLAGLKRLLQNIGLHRIRTVQHHEQAGHHPHHDHHHHHHHHHHHEGNHSHHQHLHSSQKFPVSEAPDVENEGRDEHLDTPGKTSSSVVVAAAQVVGTAAGYTPQQRAFNQQDSSTGQQNPDGEIYDPDHDHSHNHSLDSTECLSAFSILSSHGMSKRVGVTINDFSFLCPALLNQIDGAACILHIAQHDERGHQLNEHAHPHHGNQSHASNNGTERTAGDGGKSIATAWLGGFLSITIISLLSLLGVVLIPLMNRVFFKFLLSFLVALAVGTLSGDAFLHLIPHSQGGHHHHHHEDSGMNMEGYHLHEEGEENLDAVWKGLTALGGVYFMFLIEHFLTLGKMYKDKKQKIQKKSDENDKVDPALEDNKAKPSEDMETNGTCMFGEHSGSPRGSIKAEEEEVMLEPEESVSPQGHRRASESSNAYTAEDCENKCHSHFHDTVGQADSAHHHHHKYHHILHHHHSQNHHPHSHSHSYSEQHFQEAGVATLAWMVIMGDGLHNFSDGLAIGAAFTEGLSSGLSTSVAVFCHELPHELGDFAVLLKAGMTVRQAILYNVLSAMMAYFGMIMGILIGHYAENISMWIFALTAGLFMYVALVDMVPEMLHNDAGDQGFGHCCFFLLQNAGILLGFCIMLLIALFEHRIHLDLGD
ncbi:zinc transporter ZIP6 isoform X2 [Gouania willdenowi]|nr:zinc transporter ZIP6 isoform X2 [Gouania willdenowi]XP_028328261.1 zinc transporter ZIP6 isoform X2 [Gouania willdenowi]